LTEALPVRDATVCGVTTHVDDASARVTTRAARLLRRAVVVGFAANTPGVLKQAETHAMLATTRGGTRHARRRCEEEEGKVDGKVEGCLLSVTVQKTKARKRPKARASGHRRRNPPSEQCPSFASPTIHFFWKNVSFITYTRERVSLDSIEKGQKALAIIDVNQIWFFDNKFGPSANDSLYS
jgi:hypothetical protein